MCSYLGRLRKLSLLLCVFLATVVPHARANNCCELTEEQLQDMRGRSDSCPSSSTLQTVSKCMECAPNTCRVGILCYCPGRFLSSSTIQRRCEESFLSVWPQSIGKEDRHWRSCDSNFEPPKPSITSCCDMNEEQLEALVGTSDSCPSSTTVTSLLAKCLPCPPGTCRLNTLCYCPSRFWSSSTLQRQCSESFGEPWPNSIGMEDTDWRSCNTSGEQPVSADGSTADEGAAADEGTSAEGQSDESKDSSANGSSSGSSTSNSATGTATGSNTENTINVDGSITQTSGEGDENSLSTLEVVGIVAGVVSAIVTVIGGLAALRKRKRNRKQVYDMEEDDAVPQQL